MKEKIHPTIFVLFGATGDLAARKVVPGLFHLFEKKMLPSRFAVIGTSRSQHGDQEFQEYVKKVLEKHLGKAKKAKIEQFIQNVMYVSGSFSSKRLYRDLNNVIHEVDSHWGQCSNKLFHLAVPPKLYEGILLNLHRSQLADACSDTDGWTRIIIEKPFGNNIKTARKLDELLDRLFEEEQIYRVDHYLAKEMLQNIMSFRFANNFFIGGWNSKHVEKISVRILEKLTVKDRGAFYDSVGALRDVGENHLLQMLALVLMREPKSFDARHVRAAREDALSSLKAMTVSDVRCCTVRAQYKGFSQHKGVSSKSQTETYFKILAAVDNNQWRDLPIELEAGKAMKNDLKEIVVTFKHPSDCSLCKTGSAVQHQDRVIFRMAPKNEIVFEFWAKKPGHGMELTKQVAKISYNKKEKIEAYERLLWDAIRGDQLSFVSTEEVRNTWRFVDPIEKAWTKNLVPLQSYSKGTSTIRDAEFSLSDKKTILEHKTIGIVGLGKMGSGLAMQLRDKGWVVHGFDMSELHRGKVASEGVHVHESIPELVQQLPHPRVIWTMVPSGEPIESVLFANDGLYKHLQKKDIVVEGGNSLYKQTVRRSKKFLKKGIHLVDAGVSGGPSGARNGACIMVGGPKKMYSYLEPLFNDLVVEGGVQHFEGYGAGHFVKMVHNGIEYGMMQAIAEGFEIMKKSKFKPDLLRVADVYNNGSVIESRLIGWLYEGLKLHGVDLKDASCEVGHLGEGEWTVDTAHELKVRAKVIEEAFRFRVETGKGLCLYQGRVLSLLRVMFGGKRDKGVK